MYANNNEYEWVLSRYVIRRYYAVGRGCTLLSIDYVTSSLTKMYWKNYS